MPVWLIILIVGGVCAIGAIITYRMFDMEYTPIMLGAISLIYSIIAFPIVVCLESTEDYIVYDNIYSVRGTDDEVSGRFFLGSGSVDEKTYYVVFIKDKYGIKMEKYNVRNTYIVEVSDGHYYIRYVKKKWEMNGSYLIHVPEGTVIVEYKI